MAKPQRTDILAENKAKKEAGTLTAPAPFERGTRIGYSFLDIRTGESVFLDITGFENKTNKNGETKPFWTATNRVTGEEGLIFIDGGLKGASSSMGGPEGLVGQKIEIIWKGQVKVETDDGDPIMVNSYQMYLTKN